LHLLDVVFAWWGAIGFACEAGEDFYCLDLFAEVFEGAAGGAIDPGALGVGGGDAGDELGGFEADVALLEGVDEVVEALGAAGEAEFAAEGGARHA
jgi:hypothetical protein